MSKSILVLATVLLFLASGCSDNGARLRIIEESFTPDERALVVSAVDEWRAAGAFIMLTDDSDDTIAGFEDHGQPEGGWTDVVSVGETCYRRRVKLAKFADKAMFYKTALHELGHALDCKGTHLPHGNVMTINLQYNPGQLTEEDLEWAGIK